MLLPLGRDPGELADLAFLDIVNQQASGGGIAAFDPLWLSAHGLSFRHMRFFVHALDITHPLGGPTIRLPAQAWSAIEKQALWTDTPGLTWRLRAIPPAYVTTGFGRDVGGGTWIPSGFMDREPATEFGATPTRRALRPALELGAGGGGVLGVFNISSHAWAVRHRHLYPTLTDAADEAERYGALWTLSRGPASVFLVVQNEQREHEGAEFRWPKSWTQVRDSEALALGFELHWESLRASIGATKTRDVWRRHATPPPRVDVLDQWLWLRRPFLGGALAGGTVQGTVQWTPAAGFTLALRGSRQSVSSAPARDDTTTLETYAGSPSDPTVAVRTLHPRRSDVWIEAARLEMDHEADWLTLHLRLLGALDFSATGDATRRTLGFLSPALGIGAERSFGATRLYALVRREPAKLGYQEAQFLGDQSMAERHAWDDDGDLVLESGEQAHFLSRHGGPFHQAGSLSRPSHNQFRFGVERQQGPWSLAWSGIGRWYRDAFRVAASPPRVITPVVVGDPQEPGRELVLFATDDAVQTYELTNAGSQAFLGMELQARAHGAHWLLSIGGAAYWSAGDTPPGTFADVADPAAISETTADPNSAVPGWGRIDSDRSFHLKLLGALVPWPGFSIGTAARYRDGQPFGRFVVADLPQGPTVVMAHWRGHSRHTFALTWDVRLRYERPLGPVLWTLQADVTNLLGSGTELVEDPRSGSTWRQALEMVPGRTVFLSLQAAWLRP